MDMAGEWDVGAGGDFQRLAALTSRRDAGASRRRPLQGGVGRGAAYFQRLAALASCGRRATEDGGPYRGAYAGAGLLRNIFYLLSFIFYSPSSSG